MLTSADIAAMRTISQSWTMTTVCVIQRKTSSSDGMGGQSDSWATLATTVCSLAPFIDKDHETVNADRLELVSGWIVGLPATTDVTEKDRLLINGATYEVARVRSFRTIEIARDCVCYEVK